MGTARRDGYVAKAVNAQRTGTATLEQERGGERGRGGREGGEGGSLQTDQSALSAAESWTDEQCGETDRGAREGGGGEAEDGDSLVVVGGDGGTDGCDSPQLSRPPIQLPRRSSNAVWIELTAVG